MDKPLEKQVEIFSGKPISGRGGGGQPWGVYSAGEENEAEWGAVCDPTQAEPGWAVNRVCACVCVEDEGERGPERERERVSIF